MKHWAKNKSELSGNKWGTMRCLAKNKNPIGMPEKIETAQQLFKEPDRMIWLLIRLVSYDSSVAFIHIQYTWKQLSEESEAVKADREKTRYFMTYNKREGGRWTDGLIMCLCLQSHKSRLNTVWTHLDRGTENTFTPSLNKTLCCYMKQPINVS